MAITVIVADDHQIVRESLKALLEQGGFKVVGEAANGQEALKLEESSSHSSPHRNRSPDASIEMSRASVNWRGTTNVSDNGGIPS
jgi:CheY-like chemotaxis protein